MYDASSLEHHFLPPIIIACETDGIRGPDRATALSYDTKDLGQGGNTGGVPWGQGVTQSCIFYTIEECLHVPMSYGVKALTAFVVVREWELVQLLPPFLSP